MEENKNKSINTQEPITYEEAFKKLGAFIQKTRQEEREKELMKEDQKENE